VEAYSEVVSDFPLADREKLFSGNAERIFRL
jgi:predicted TIM-barrel fold metal-dependent hydrolase